MKSWEDRQSSSTKISTITVYRDTHRRTRLSRQPGPCPLPPTTHTINENRGPLAPDRSPVFTLVSTQLDQRLRSDTEGRSPGVVCADWLGVLLIAVGPPFRKSNRLEVAKNGSEAWCILFRAQDSQTPE